MQPSAKPERQNPVPHRPPARLSPRERIGLAVLAVLAAGWISTLARSWIPASLDTEPTKPLARDSRWISSPATVPLQLAALHRQNPAFQPGRNLFTFATVPAPDAGGREPDTGQTGADEKVIHDPRLQPPEQPALDVDFLGVFGPERLRVGVLKEPGAGAITNVLEHDLVQEQYRVLQIDRQSIQLRDTADPGAAPIRLGAEAKRDW